MPGQFSFPRWTTEGWKIPTAAPSGSHPRQTAVRFAVLLSSFGEPAERRARRVCVKSWSRPRSCQTRREVRPPRVKRWSRVSFSKPRERIVCRVCQVLVMSAFRELAERFVCHVCRVFIVSSFYVFVKSLSCPHATNLSESFVPHHVWKLDQGYKDIYLPVTLKCAGGICLDDVPFIECTN